MADAKTRGDGGRADARPATRSRSRPGLVVSDLTPGMPAIKVLHWGDVIVSRRRQDARRRRPTSPPRSRSTRSATSVALVVERAGKRLDVTVKVGVFTDPAVKGHKGIGVELSPRFTFPVKVNVDTTDIGGPSAGLAMTLAIFDDLTPGNLTGGARVAVTGTIDADGNVGEIGGIEQKAVAARAAGVVVVHRPAVLARRPARRISRLQGRPGARREACRVARSRSMPVSTFAQALHGAARERRRSGHGATTRRRRSRSIDDDTA